MPRQIHWRELTVGIIAAAAIAALIVVVLLFARVGALHGKKVTLYVVTSGASGVLPGTEVWLAGGKEGVVTKVAFRPPSTDTSERILITTQFREKAMPSVRKDSYAQIRPGGSIIGAIIINISAGTVGSPPLHDGDTVHTRPKPVIMDLPKDVSTIGPEFAALGAATKKLADMISRPVGTVGNYRTDGLADLPDVRAGATSLTARATRGNGTIAQAMRGDLRARASHAMAAADSIRTLVSSDKGSLGRFRRDTTLVTKAGHVMSQLDSLLTMLSNPVGTIAAAHPDSALVRQLEREHILMAALIKDIKSNPLRYIRF